MSPTDTAGPDGPFSEISTSEFRALQGLILERAGIALNDSKRVLVTSRLGRRLRALGLRSYGDYYDRLTRDDPCGDELREMLNCITTNKTDFFREPHHFDFVRTQVQREALERARRGGPRKLRVWSAGCSSGEEPYTLAMTLLSGFENPGSWQFEIVATDIDTEVLARAEQGVYTEENVRPVPEALRRRFLRRGLGENAGKVRIAPELRELIRFERLNLIERPWPVQGPFDLIFCRNVLIYFNRDTQHAVVEGFRELLHESGYLFLGHSESLQSHIQTYEPLRGTIYRVRARAGASGEPPVAAAEASAPPAAPAPIGGARAAGAARPQPARPAPLALDPEASLPLIHVTIGGVRASAASVRLRTMLGSCVCACLYDPIARIGGINHFMLPEGLPDGEMPTRYGVNAMEKLINEILKLGGDRARLRAKAFGAAHVLVGAGLSPEVPRKNAAFIKEFLGTEGIPLMGQRLGGSAPVEVIFHTASGRALARPLGQKVAADLAREESQFDLEVRRGLVQPPRDSVTLFDDSVTLFDEAA